MVEQMIYMNFDSIMEKIGKRIKSTVIGIDPFMIESGKKLIGESFETLWPEVQVGMKQQLDARYDPEKQKKKKDFREFCLNVDNWPQSPPFWPRPLHWLRCRALYSWMPADLTLFGRLRSPEMWPLLLLLIVSPPEMAFFVWLYLYSCIDRTDEYQLMTFAVLFRGFAFVSVGVFWSAAAFQRGQLPHAGHATLSSRSSLPPAARRSSSMPDHACSRPWHRAVKGFFQLYVCTSGEFSCATEGPGVSSTELRSLLFFMGRMLLGADAYQTLCADAQSLTLARPLGAGPLDTRP